MWWTIRAGKSQICVYVDKCLTKQDLDFKGWQNQFWHWLKFYSWFRSGIGLMDILTNTMNDQYSQSVVKLLIGIGRVRYVSG